MSSFKRAQKVPAVFCNRWINVEERRTTEGYKSGSFITPHLLTFFVHFTMFIRAECTQIWSLKRQSNGKKTHKEQTKMRKRQEKKSRYEKWKYVYRMTAFVGIRLTCFVPFEMVTKHRSCDKTPEQPLLSLRPSLSEEGGGDVGVRATETALQTGEDKTTYGGGPSSRMLSPCGALKDPFSSCLPPT